FAAIDLPQKVGQVARDDVGDVLRERIGGGEAGGVADGVFGPVGVAPAELGEAADVGDGVVGDFAFHGGAATGAGGVAAAPLVVVGFLVGCGAGGTSFALRLLALRGVVALFDRRSGRRFFRGRVTIARVVGRLVAFVAAGITAGDVDGRCCAEV